MRKQFVDLTYHEQAVIVLLALLEDVATEKRTMAGIEHHIAMLFNVISEHFDLPDHEVEIVVEAVAKRGVEMLPGWKAPNVVASPRNGS